VIIIQAPSAKRISGSNPSASSSVAFLVAGKLCLALHLMTGLPMLKAGDGCILKLKLELEEDVTHFYVYFSLLLLDYPKILLQISCSPLE